MDALSALISGWSLRRAICTRFELTAPWGHEVANLDPVKFVLVLNGSCWLKTRQSPRPVRLTPGDLFFVLDGRAYSLSDSPRGKVVDCRQLENDIPLPGSCQAVDNFTPTVRAVDNRSNVVSPLTPPGGDTIAPDRLQIESLPSRVAYEGGPALSRCWGRARA